MQAPERKIVLPPATRPSEEDLDRRNGAFERILRIRSQMRPLGVDTAEWVWEDRERDERDDQEDSPWTLPTEWAVASMMVCTWLWLRMPGSLLSTRIRGYTGASTGDFPSSTG